VKVRRVRKKIGSVLGRRVQAESETPVDIGLRSQIARYRSGMMWTIQLLAGIGAIVAFWSWVSESDVRIEQNTLRTIDLALRANEMLADPSEVIPDSARTEAANFLISRSKDCDLDFSGSSLNGLDFSGKEYCKITLYPGSLSGLNTDGLWLSVIGDYEGQSSNDAAQRELERTNTSRPVHVSGVFANGSLGFDGYTTVTGVLFDSNLSIEERNSTLPENWPVHLALNGVLQKGGSVLIDNEVALANSYFKDAEINLVASYKSGERVTLRNIILDASTVEIKPYECGGNSFSIGIVDCSDHDQEFDVLLENVCSINGGAVIGVEISECDEYFGLTHLDLFEEVFASPELQHEFSGLSYTEVEYVFRTEFYRLTDSTSTNVELCRQPQLITTHASGGQPAIQSISVPGKLWHSGPVTDVDVSINDNALSWLVSCLELSMIRCDMAQKSVIRSIDTCEYTDGTKVFDPESFDR